MTFSLLEQENSTGGLGWDSLGWGGATGGTQGMLNNIFGENWGKTAGSGLSKMPGLGGSQGNSFGGMLSSKGADGSVTQGWGGQALGAATGLANAYTGFKNLKIAKDTLKFNKDKFAKNYDAQKRTTNASLEDRQRGRVASNAGAYESVGSYMDKNGIR